MREQVLSSDRGPGFVSTYVDVSATTIPPVRPSLPQRRRLVARLDAGLHAKLMLISAAPGSGKTTLLAGWARDLVRRGRRVAWLTAEARHNDPAKFWEAVVAALERAWPAQFSHVRDLLHGPLALDSEAVASSLAHALAARHERITLVVDDHHCIGNRSIHEGMEFLLEHLPPRVPIVLCGRHDPPLPIARMRAAGQLVEIRTDDLRLTRDETRSFLISGDIPPLTNGEIDELHTQTEGWVAGIGLVALALTETDRGHLRGATKRPIHRFAVDYLLREVFDQQPQEIQVFLMSTCILDRLCAPLCDAVTGIAASGRILAYLESSGLFVTPIDDQRQWFRYHALFAGAAGASGTAAARGHPGPQPPRIDVAGEHRRRRRDRARGGHWGP